MLIVNKTYSRIIEHKLIDTISNLIIGLKAARTQCTPVNILYFSLKTMMNMNFNFIRWFLFFPNY